MAITLVTGPANAGKAQLAIDAARGHLARGEQPLLVVPTRADVEHYRHELAGDGALMGGRVERFAELVREVVERAGVSRPVLGGAARDRVLATAAQRALAREPSRGASRLAVAAREFVAELRLRRVSPARLDEALSRWSGAGAPARALGDLYRGYDDALRQIGCIDAEQRATLALDSLRRRPALWGGTPVVVYGFDDFDRLQLDVIETLGSVVDARLTVSLTFEPGRVAFAGRAGTFQALAPLADRHERLAALATYYAPGAGGALGHLERSLFEAAPRRVDADGAVRLLEGAGERSELGLVAREIRTLLDGGMAPEEIAVVLRLDGSASDLVEDVFASETIPFALQRRRSLGDTALGRALVALLNCAGPRGELEDLLSFLRAPGVLSRPELADDLEASARRIGVASAAAARALWEERHWTLDALDHMQQAAERGSSALIERARRELLWLFWRPRAGLGAVLADDELDEAGALRGSARALSELADLARRAPALAPSDPHELARALQSVELVSGDPPGRAQSPSSTPLRCARAVCAPCFSAACRRTCSRARRASAACSPTRSGAAWPKRPGCDSGPTRMRSRPSATCSTPPSRAPRSCWCSAGTPQTTTARRARDRCSSTICATCSTTGCAPSARAAVESPLAAGSAGDQRLSRAPLSAAGGDLCAELLDEQPLATLLQRRVWSASSLEAWIRCPMRWFVERALGARDLEAEPEPLARGGLAHAALKDVFEGLRDAVGSARVTAQTEALACDLLRDSLELRAAQFPLSVAPERAAAVRRRLQADLERYLRHAACDAEDAGADVDLPEPRYLELGFGFDGEGDGDEELGALELGDELHLRGRIDRVDVGLDGAAIVYDYKGYRVFPGARWESEGALQAALYMKAAEQLLGLDVVAGLYQPLAGTDLRPRGALDRDRASHVRGYATDRIEAGELRALVERVVELAREAAGEASRGELRARPRTCGFADSGCAYPTICRCGQR